MGGSNVSLLHGHTQPSPYDVDTATHAPILIHHERAHQRPSCSLRLLAELVPQHLRDQERQLQRLLGVQPRITCRLIAAGQVRLRNVLRATKTFGDVLAGNLDMDAARMGSEGTMHLEKPCTSSTMRSK